MNDDRPPLPRTTDARSPHSGRSWRRGDETDDDRLRSSGVPDTASRIEPDEGVDVASLIAEYRDAYLARDLERLVALFADDAELTWAVGRIRRLRAYYDKLDLMHQIAARYPRVRGWVFRKLTGFLVGLGSKGLDVRPG